jgi:hypothetical protein
MCVETNGDKKSATLQSHGILRAAAPPSPGRWTILEHRRRQLAGAAIVAALQNE